MNHGCVTLEDVFAAAAARAASIVPETSGYLALALGDATSRMPFAIDERSVMLNTEGTVTVTKRGAARTPHQAAEGLRSILARLLAAGTGAGMPSLLAAARPREAEGRGVDAVVQEIEAALIPVNRAAARRALARLARETIKARETGRMKRVTARPAADTVEAAAGLPPAPSAVVPAPAVVTPPVAAPPLVEAVPAVVTPPIVAVPPSFEVITLETVAPPVDAGPAAVDPAPEVPPASLPGGSVVVAEATMSHAAEVRNEPVLVASPSATPAPIEIEIEVAATDAPEPTPTVLGMAPIDLEGFELRTHLGVATEEELPLELPAPEPTGLAAVLAQPTEDPSLAFELDDALRPVPFAQSSAVDDAPDAALPPLGDPKPIAIPAAIPECAPPPPNDAPSRADVLLARFGASCTDDDHMRATAASLRRMAGLDATPPPVRVEIRLPPPPAPPPPTALEIDEALKLGRSAETPAAPRVVTGRRRTGIGPVSRSSPSCSAWPRGSRRSASAPISWRRCSRLSRRRHPVRRRARRPCRQLRPEV